MVVVISALNRSTVGSADGKTMTVLHDVYIRFLRYNMFHIQQNPTIAVQKTSAAFCKFADFTERNPIAVLRPVCHQEYCIIVVRKDMLDPINRKLNRLAAADKIQSPAYGGHPSADIRKNLKNPFLCKIFLINIVEAMEACGLPDMFPADGQKDNKALGAHFP